MSFTLVIRMQFPSFSREPSINQIDFVSKDIFTP
jgi:hypothetical protein